MDKSTCKSFCRIAGIFTILTVFMAQTAFGDSNEELAKKLSNPIAALISVPFQFNYDTNEAGATRRILTGVV